MSMSHLVNRVIFSFLSIASIGEEKQGDTYFRLHFSSLQKALFTIQ